CIEVRNGEGERRRFQYDGRGLLIQETSPEETVHYRYDAVGRLTEVTSSVSHVQLEYDLRDRVVREWQNGTEVRRTYDEHSVTRTLLWPEEEKEEEGLTSTFRYSRTGELKQVVLPDGAELTINHDAAGRESERRGGRFLQTREYDAMGWLTREMSGQAHDGRLQAQQTREYRYDGAGNVTGVRTNRDSEGYRLDKTGRVLSVLTGG
ncbi:type IV secretion protein Rhs, partial [Lonsdalea quercina]